MLDGVSSYADFIARRTHSQRGDGFDPSFVPPQLFDFQVYLLKWMQRMGRSAIFADCGMGKTPLQLSWAQNIVERDNARVLVLTPLAVSPQTVREGEKFGIECLRSQEGRNLPKSGIVVTNYERLDNFDPANFAGVVCDESSCLKNFDGVRKQQITDFMRKVRYRLLCTATAAPNDYDELGTSSEALGHLGYVDMLGRFFVANDGRGAAAKRGWGKELKFRLKGHAEDPFWRWVAGWSCAVRRPSDLGFEDGRFVLPPLVEREHLLSISDVKPPPGKLFDVEAVGFHEQGEAVRRTVRERCEAAARLVSDGDPALVWCNLNVEGDMLEEMIPDAVQVSGSDPDRVKEERLLAFADGQIRVLVTKPRIGAWGLNFQRCAHVVVMPTHSFESYYQGVRRCWRFGQERQVTVDIVGTWGLSQIMKNLRRKAAQADEMFDRLIAIGRETRRGQRD